jgi:hypothetical protein
VAPAIEAHLVSTTTPETLLPAARTTVLNRAMTQKMVKKKILGRDMLMTFLYELTFGSVLESSVEVKG